LTFCAYYKMPTTCSAPRCTNSNKDGYCCTMFAQDPKLKQKWIDAAGIPDWKPSKSAVLCEKKILTESLSSPEKYEILKEKLKIDEKERDTLKSRVNDLGKNIEKNYCILSNVWDMAINIVKNNLGSLGKYLQAASALRYCTEMSPTYKTLVVTIPKPFVYMVKLNRPEKLNAMNPTMWKEFKECFEGLSMNPDCRVVILSAAGKTFCAGIDLQGVMDMGQSLAEHEDIARRSKLIESKIKDYQDSFTAIEKCSKPVIAVIHGACIGAGMDMISAADIRYASSNAYFQIKELDIGMAADVGTLQRFPKIVGSDSLVRELVYTARKYPAAEALESGFISRMLDNEESLLNKSIEVAEDIASKSPVAVQGSKMSLVYSRDHSVQEGLDHIAMHNKAMLQSEDFLNAAMAQAVKGDPPIFSKL
ncbi:ECH1 protein, partial [Acromyrmex insinuator]